MSGMNFYILRIALALLTFISFSSYGQTCSGSLGEPIFKEDFGTGSRASLAFSGLGTTTYRYEDGLGNSSRLDDGNYTLYSGDPKNLNQFWHTGRDHTLGDTNGRMAIFNASFTKGEFFRRTVTGLCKGTMVVFSAWVTNVYNTNSKACRAVGVEGGIPVNITFEIWKDDGNAGNISLGNLLTSVSTGDIYGSNSLVWNKYAAQIPLASNTSEVVVILRNNGVGGCGNDLAIDDIEFRVCGPKSTVSQNLTPGCSNKEITITATMASGYENPYIIWQKYISSTNSWENVTAEEKFSENNSLTISSPINSRSLKRFQHSDLQLII